MPAAARGGGRAFRGAEALDGTRNDAGTAQTQSTPATAPPRDTVVRSTMASKRSSHRYCTENARALTPPALASAAARRDRSMVRTWAGLRRGAMSPGNQERRHARLFGEARDGPEAARVDEAVAEDDVLAVRVPGRRREEGLEPGEGRVVPRGVAPGLVPAVDRRLRALEVRGLGRQVLERPAVAWGRRGFASGFARAR